MQLWARSHHNSDDVRNLQNLNHFHEYYIIVTMSYGDEMIFIYKYKTPTNHDFVGLTPSKIMGFVGACLASLALMSNSAWAATATDTMTVTATVPDTCIITADDLAFGDYNPFSGSVLNGASTVSVTCTTGSTFNVGLNQGGGSGATVATRKMTSPASDTLNYSLYQNPGRTTVWGNTIGNNTVSSTGIGSAQVFDVYGQISASQSVPPGSYSDTITVTVTF